MLVWQDQVNTRQLLRVINLHEIGIFKTASFICVVFRGGIKPDWWLTILIFIIIVIHLIFYNSRLLWGKTPIHGGYIASFSTSQI